MKSIRKMAIPLLVTCWIAVSARAADLDLQNCRFGNGNPIEPRLCELMSRTDLSEAQRTQTLQRLRAESEEASRRDAEDRKAEQQRQRDQEEAARKARWEEEQAARKKAEEAERARQAAEDARTAKWFAQRKKECGADYARPSVGMTLERAKHCVGDFELYSQVNRADGVVSNYRAGPMHIAVMNGRVVQWARY